MSPAPTLPSPPRRTIDASPDEVFRVLADAARYSDWLVGPARIREETTA